MNRYEGSEAVASARKAVIFFAWLLIFGGVITLFLSIEAKEIAALGFAFIGLGISLCIRNAVLKGVEKITYASELYIEEIERRKSAEREEKEAAEENEE